MVEENVSVADTEITAIQPQDESQDAAKVETPDADPPKPEGEKVDTAKEDIEASEAARKLNERRQQKAERYRNMERRAHEAERRAIQLQARIAEYEKVERPDPAKFDNIADYDAENAKYGAAQIRKQEITLDVSDARQEAAQARTESYREALQEYVAENPTFNPNAFIQAAQGYQYANELAEVIQDDPIVGIQLMDVLLKSPADLARIASLPPRAQLREIARIEANLSKPAPKKITQAPEPVKAVKGNATNTAALNFDKMSQAEYNAYREKNGK